MCIRDSSYPMLDLLLVAAVAGIAALRGMRMGSRWGLLAVGLLIFATADVVYALQRTTDTYVVGTPLDAGWANGLALVAMWVDGTAQHDVSAARETRPATGPRALGVSSVATVAGLGVLVVGTWVPLSRLAVTLAGVTLLAAAARSQLAFRLLARMADLRRLAAATDDLTGLPNRRALYAEGRARLARPQRRRHALLMLDLDKFKGVNDSLGHHAGDQLLVQVGARLREHLRGGDMLARLGGDEFAVLLGDAGHEEATNVAVKLRGALDDPFAIDGIMLHSSVSVGIALYPGDGPDLSTLLRKADIAMYKAKAPGDGVHFYGSGDYTDGAARLQMLEELRTAIATDRLVLHYQPKIDLDTGDVHAVEALVRWDHASRGLLYPDVFLALVEEAGLMPRLTRVVLAAALDQVATWHAHGQQLTVAVNLSASSLVDVDLPEEIAAMLADRGVAPHALQLEVTEEFLMADRERARDILTRLRRSGVQISVDDFGTGYSSLSYLRDLPIDELKLDRSFVFPMADDAPRRRPRRLDHRPGPQPRPAHRRRRRRDPRRLHRAGPPGLRSGTGLLHVQTRPRRRARPLAQQPACYRSAHRYPQAAPHRRPRLTTHMRQSLRSFGTSAQPDRVVSCRLSTVPQAERPRVMPQACGGAAGGGVRIGRPEVRPVMGGRNLVVVATLGLFWTFVQ